MSQDETLINYLIKLGLSIYEAKTYISLIESGPKSASELGFLSGVPRPKVYGAIKSLERKGLAKITPGNPLLFSASQPDKQLSKAVEKMRNEVKMCEDAINTISLKYETSKYVRKRTPQEMGNIWPISDRGEALKRFKDLTSEAEHTINIVTTRNGILRLYKTGIEYLDAAALRGVEIRLLAPFEERDRHIVEELKDIVLIRPLENISKASLITFDSKRILFFEVYPDDLNPKLGNDKGFWTENANLTTLEDKLFQEIWNRNPMRRKTEVSQTI